MKKMMLLFAMLFAGSVAFAQIPVTISVDMGVQVFKGNFNMATDTVVIRGDFQVDAGDPGAANWSGNYFKLTDGNADTIYSITINLPTNKVGTTYNYKYVKAPDGWEAGDNRTFTLASSAMTLPTYWFSNDSIYKIIINVDNTINFTANLTSIYGTGVGYFDPNSDSIQVMGLDWDGLGTVLSGNRRMVEDPLSPGIFTTSMTIRGPLGDSTKWKFKAFPDARFTNTGWETGQDRWFKYVTTGSTVTLDPIVPRIFPVIGNLTQNVTVKFQCNMNNNPVNAHNGLPINPANVAWVGVKGGSAPIGNWGGTWTTGDTAGATKTLMVMNDAGINGDLVAGDKVFTADVVFPTGTGAGAIEFKFAAWYPGADTVNSGSVPLDNEGGFGQNHLFVLREPGPIKLKNDFGNFLTSIKDNPDLNPDNFKLLQNFPNPFNPSTKISYAIPENGLVTLKVYNAIGQQVATLVNQYQVAGGYDVDFSAKNLNNGVYFYSITFGNSTITKKMILIK